MLHASCNRVAVSSGNRAMVEYFLPVGKDVRPPSSGEPQCTFATTDLPITKPALQQHLVVEAMHQISLGQSQRGFPTAPGSWPHGLEERPARCDSDLPPPASRPTGQRPPRSLRRTCPPENSEPLQTSQCAQ